MKLYVLANLVKKTGLLDAAGKRRDLSQLIPDLGPG